MYKLSLTTLMLITFFVSLQEVIYYTDTGKVEFTSSVPLHEFTGRSEKLTGMIDFEKNLIDFYLDLTTLYTGNERRDRDMYRTLNVDDYPFAEFTGSLTSPFDQDSREKQLVTTSGELTMNGVTRNKVVEGSLQKQGDDLLLEAVWIQDITDHNIEPPGILFYRVRDEMEVKIEATLQQTEK
ncbi:MAG: YceI family protein [Balneolales bacterium]